MLRRIFTLSGGVAFVLIFILASLASASSPPLAPSVVDELYAPDRILVRFAPGVSASTMAAIHRANGAVLIREIPQIAVQVLRVPSNRVPEMVAAYSRNPNVLYAEPDYIAHIVGDPNDPHFAKQWGLDNDGQAYKDSISGTVDADIDAPEAWDIATGSSEVKIAILDTGIDQDHEDLCPTLTSCKIVANKNFTDSPTVDDKYGHGTHVAGITAAITNNGMGVAGVGYNSSLLNVKVLNDQGSGYYSWIADGIVWAANNGAKVINMSLGGYFTSSTLESAVNYAWDNGVVLAAAAGNDGTSRKLYPAAYTNCIAVAATDADDQRVKEPGWWASNYGDWVDVAAPGLYIYSTFPNHPYAIDKSLNYDYGSGTSMATPHVAGLAALVWATGYGTSNQVVRERIELYADDVPGTGTYWIHGRINACNAVGGNCSYGGEQPPPPTLVSIAVTPTFASIFVGGTQQFTAIGTFSDGSTADLTSTATWASSNTAVATIAAGGLATGVAAGTTTITATDGVLSNSATLTVTEPPTPGGKMHVGDLDGSKNLKGKSGRWEVFVTVTIHDENENLVANATVYGTWSGDTTGSASGTTGGDGTVTFSTGNMSGGTSVTFTVTNVTHDTLTYDATANHDVDGDSHGITITVGK